MTRFSHSLNPMHQILLALSSQHIQNLTLLTTLDQATISLPASLLNWAPQFHPFPPSISTVQSDTIKPLSHIMSLHVIPLLHCCFPSQNESKSFLKNAQFLLELDMLPPGRDDFIYYYTATMTLHTVSQTHHACSYLKAFELAPSARNALPADTHMAGSLNFCWPLLKSS